MIKRLVSFALQQPLFLMMLTLIFIGGGIVAFRSLPIEAFPDVSDVQVTVITLFPGRAAEEVEKQVTLPLEIGLSGLPHSVRMFSHTQFGLSYLILTFDDQVSDYFARQQVVERLKGVDLPNGVSADLAPLSTAIGEIYRYRLKGSGRDSRDLRTIQDWTVARQLKMVPGVADVVSFGGLIKQYEVNPNLGKLRYYNVTLQQLFTALQRANANAGGSYVEQGQQQYLIRGIGLLRSSADLGGIVLGENQGSPIRIQDVAQVKVSAVPRQGIVGQDTDDEAVTGIVVMRKGENPSAVLQSLKARVDVLNRSLLPPGVRLEPYYDRSWLIHTTLHTVFKNLTEGAILVTLVLLLFLGNIRAALIVAAVIPLSLLATFIGLSWRGIPANLLSLGAMDFGIIVDGAVIVVENIFRHLSELQGGRSSERLKSAIQTATAEVGRPTFFSMLIIIVAHIPIFALQRHEGRIFAPMAWTVTSALIGSLILSLTLVPLLCYWLLRRPLAEEESGIMRISHRLYRPLLAWALARKKLVVTVAIVALSASLATLPKIGTEFLPELNEGSIWINVMLPPSISVSEAVKQCAKMRAALRTVPEVETVVSKSGRPEDGTDPKLINMCEIFVSLHPPEQWKRKVTKEQVIEDMNRALSAIPGIEPSFSQPIRDNILESISQIDGQVVIKIFGDDLPIIKRHAEEVMRTIEKIPGVARTFVDRLGELPQSVIEIDRERAARYNLNVMDIQDVIETGLGGRAATELWEGEKHFSVVVRLSEPERSLANLPAILVDTPSGNRIPLGAVATFKTLGGSMNISREDGQRLFAVSVFIGGRDMGSVVRDMQAAVAANVHLTPGYTITWGGEFENQQRAMRRLALIVPISIFLIFVLLFDAFKTVKSAVLILLNVPFALIGGILALLFTGIPLSVSAAIGFIALFGQAVLNGVVMVSYFNQLREKGASAFEAVVKGASMRLRTVLMTALLAMLGLLPMALSHGIGSETQRPLAVVIIGGLVSATLLTLLVLPSLYLLILGEDESAPSTVNKASTI
jgi:cobalt-zinc-cadmium resistance protein CzcA